jgi:hypothetical protein
MNVILDMPNVDQNCMILIQNNASFHSKKIVLLNSMHVSLEIKNDIKKITNIIINCIFVRKF